MFAYVCNQRYVKIFSVKYVIAKCADENGVDGISVIGPPEAPRGVRVISIASKMVNVTWKAGHDGGSLQTFRIVWTNTDSKESVSFSTPFVDHKPGTTMNFTVNGLKPANSYSLSVYSMTNYSNGSETASKEIFFTTTGKHDNNINFIFA